MIAGVRIVPPPEITGYSILYGLGYILVRTVPMGLALAGAGGNDSRLVLLARSRYLPYSRCFPHLIRLRILLFFRLLRLQVVS